MALTANVGLDHYVDQELRTFELSAAVHVFKGALIGLTTAGFARPLVAGDAFVGIAYEEVDNSAGTNGLASARVYTLGDFGLALSGATQTQVGDAVYASADDTLTFTATANSFVGVAIDVPTAGNIILRLDVLRTAP